MIYNEQKSKPILIGLCNLRDAAVGLYHMCCDAAVHVTISTIRNKNEFSEVLSKMILYGPK